MTSIADILTNVFTSAPCDFCQSAGLTYTDPETRCRFCLDCLVIAVESEGEELPEDPEITHMGQDYLKAQRIAA